MSATAPRAELPSSGALTSGAILPDRLRTGLKVIFCGSAAGPKSARVRAYYAGPGNRFWPTLHAVGLTPRAFAPHEYPALLDLDIGLTDLAKSRWGVDSADIAAGYDPAALRRKILRHKPWALAFNSKTPAQVFLGRACGYGLQEEMLGATALFVLPSTSRRATRFWDETHWHSLADYLRERAAGTTS